MWPERVKVGLFVSRPVCVFFSREHFPLVPEIFWLKPLNHGVGDVTSVSYLEGSESAAAEDHPS